MKHLLAILALTLSFSAFAKEKPYTVEVGKKMIKEYLVVLDGVKFRNLFVNKYTFVDENGTTQTIKLTCGEISAKNRFGAQLNYQWFYISELGGVHGFSNDAHEESFILQFCFNK